MKSIVLQKFANREVRFGWQDMPSNRPKPTDSESVITRTKESELIALSAIDLHKTRAGAIAYDPSKPSLTKLNHDELKRTETQVQRSLDITSEFRRERNRRRKNKKVPGTPNRCTVFGRAARHTMLEAASVASRWSGSVGNSVVVTLTLPGSTREAYAALAAWSGYAFDRLARWLRKASSRVRWFYVWELQKRGALHLHILVAAQSSITALYVGSKLRSAWFEVLKDIGRKSGVDMFCHAWGDRCTVKSKWQNDIQHVTKDIAAYFSKYASKNTQSAKKGFNNKAIVHPYHPSRWWGCQRLLRQEVEQERFHVRLEGVTEEQVVQALTLADNWCNAHNPIMRYRYDFELSYVCNGENRPLGYGERHVVYFNDDAFTHVCDDIVMLARYLAHVCNGAYLQCNRMSAMQTPVVMWSMQSERDLAVP